MSMVEGSVDVVKEVVPGWGEIVRRGTGKGNKPDVWGILGGLCYTGPDVESLVSLISHFKRKAAHMLTLIPKLTLMEFKRPIWNFSRQTCHLHLATSPGPLHSQQRSKSPVSPTTLYSNTVPPGPLFVILMSIPFELSRNMPWVSVILCLMYIGWFLYRFVLVGTPYALWGHSVSVILSVGRWNGFMCLPNP